MSSHRHSSPSHSPTASLLPLHESPNTDLDLLLLGLGLGLALPSLLGMNEHSIQEYIEVASASWILNALIVHEVGRELLPQRF